jgi:hypothetical protein
MGGCVEVHHIRKDARSLVCITLGTCCPRGVFSISKNVARGRQRAVVRGLVMHKGFRDAIHVPFVMVTCGDTLRPAEKCSLRDENQCVRWQGGSPDIEPMWHGIADPFRESEIPSGEVFPLYIRKECFHGLTHDFQIEVHDRGGTGTCHSVCDIF